MKCYPCGFEGKVEEFGKIYLLSNDGSSSFIGRMPRNHIGSVTVYVCPKCGALHSDMRGAIEYQDRKS